MTTNEIMANLEKMSATLDTSILVLNNGIEDVISDSKQKWHAMGMRDTMVEWKHWIDILMKKHWEEEDKMISATMFLHMND